MDLKHSDGERQVDMTIKREPVEEMITPSNEYPVDMSVVSRDSGSELTHPQYAHPSVNMSRDMNNRTFFQAAFYGQNMIGHCPEMYSQQHFPGHLPSHQIDHQKQRISPPSASRQQPNTPSQHTTPPQMRAAHHALPSPSTSSASESPSASSDLLKKKLNFKLKGSDGKLSLPEMLSSDNSGYGSLDLVPLTTTHQRAKREFVPDNKKDTMYWNKRLKNNDSARRSRVKRKALEKLMESRLMDLQKENIELRHEMAAIKRRFGILDDTPVKASGSGMSPQEHMPNEVSSPSFARDEELEQQSAGSDDSHSHDDSRAYNLSSVSALSHSLGITGRERADSFGSGTSSGDRSSRPDSRSSQTGSLEGRTDKIGALDLSSDHSNRSTPASDSNSQEASMNSSQKSANNSPVCDSDMDDLKNGMEIRGFPLKCRWKREMQSVANLSKSSQE